MADKSNAAGLDSNQATIRSDSWQARQEQRSLDELIARFSPATSDAELGWLAHYRVLKLLGRGGMGAVFLAEETRLQRPVALKIMLPELAEQAPARERFLREARAVASLRNDHVVTVYDVNQENDLPYLAMEVLKGKSLEQHLEDGERFPIPEILRIGREIAQGLAAAHEANLIHRDIKPANIWLEEGTGRVRILDFGLARPVQSQGNLTQTGNIVGTPFYMSPEQAQGKHLDASSDLFSLGVVLFQLTTHQLPFEGKDLFSFLSALATQPPRNIHLINPNVPEPLATLIERLLQKDPTQRPASAADVVPEFRALEAGMPSGLNTGQQRITTVNLHVPTQRPQHPTPPCSRLPSWKSMTLAGGVLLGLVVLSTVFSGRFRGQPTGIPAPTGAPVRIGLLHSRTGTMALSERPILDAITLAVDEVNQRGGVLGRPLEVVVEDGQSDESVFADKARKLITQDKVAALFGCWTSASRKAVKPVVEQEKHLLFYPVSYEGMEESNNIVYGGAVPNQQILPALKWSIGFLASKAADRKQRWFLVGSDYVFPHAANAVIKDEAKVLGCSVVGEEYVLLGGGDLRGIIAKIKETQPDLILNTLNGDTNIAFFRSLRKAGIFPAQIPTLSFSISEQEATALTPRELAGDYVAGNYMQSIDRPQNAEFLKRFKARYGNELNVSDPMQTAYYSVHLWANAVQQARSLAVPEVREALRGMRFEAPQGQVEICKKTLHTIQQMRVGRFTDQGTVEEEIVTLRPIQPEAYPSTRTPAEWDSFLKSLYLGWGNRWANPGS